VVSVVVEGNRPILVEVQALVVECFGVAPKRVFRGIDFNRGQLMVAVCQKSLNVPLYKYDVFVTVAGGIKVTDPGLDLAVVAAMYSSYKGKAVNFKQKGLVFVGEVSLLGGVRKIAYIERRGKEVERLGLEMVKMGDVRELKTVMSK